MGQPQAALEHYVECHEVLTKLAAADERDAQAQRDLSISHVNLGDVLLQMGQPQAALEHYVECHEVLTKLAAADERSAAAQLAVLFSRIRMGEVHREQGDVRASQAEFQAGIAILDRMIAAGMNVEQCQQGKKLLEAEVALCESLVIATGEWEPLLQQPAEQLPQLLSQRCTLLAKRGDRAAVQQAAEKLLAIEPRTENNLYNAACGYGLCLELANGWSGQRPFPAADGIPEGTPEEQALRSEYRTKALDALRQAITAGWKDFDHMRQDTDLQALHGDADFEALFPEAD
ncbi:MAG: tetratricopeptide repeat protein [Planctomycetaceae bacterium]